MDCGLPSENFGHAHHADTAAALMAYVSPVANLAYLVSVLNQFTFTCCLPTLLHPVKMICIIHCFLGLSDVQ